MHRIHIVSDVCIHLSYCKIIGMGKHPSYYNDTDFQQFTQPYINHTDSSFEMFLYLLPFQPEEDLVQSVKKEGGSCR